MIEVLQFIFSSFWIWAGTLVLVAVAVNGLATFIIGIVGIARGARK